VDWINLAQDWGQCWALVNMVGILTKHLFNSQDGLHLHGMSYLMYVQYEYTASVVLFYSILKLNMKIFQIPWRL
jgi:hypothetical protein